MKKIAFLLVMLLLISSNAFALEDTYYNRATYKLGRGLSNLMFSPVEIFRSMDARVEEYGFGPGFPIGLIHGIGRTVARIGTGATDVVTFLVAESPSPEYMMEPEFAFDMTP